MACTASSRGHPLATVQFSFPMASTTSAVVRARPGTRTEKVCVMAPPSTSVTVATNVTI